MPYEGTCYGCTSDYIGMDHPIDAGKYKGGHDPSWPRPRGSHPLDFPDVDVCHLLPPSKFSAFITLFIFYVMPCYCCDIVER
jgi:hypothetical protein